MKTALITAITLSSLALPSAASAARLADFQATMWTGPNYELFQGTYAQGRTPSCKQTIGFHRNQLELRDWKAKDVDDRGLQQSVVMHGWLNGERAIIKIFCKKTI